MSDLSFLIESHEVPIDESFLEKCQQSNHEVKSSLDTLSKISSSKQIKLNKTKNLISSKKKTGSPRSYNKANLQSDDHFATESQCLQKFSIRIEALEENQKRMQKRIGVEFFQIKQDLQRKNVQQNQQFEEVKRLKGSLNQNKKNIADLLSMISKKK